MPHRHSLTVLLLGFVIATLGCLHAAVEHCAYCSSPMCTRATLSCTESANLRFVLSAFVAFPEVRTSTSGTLLMIVATASFGLGISCTP